MRRFRIRRPSPATALVLIGWVSFCVWVIAGWVSVHTVDEPAFSVKAHRDGYDVRAYGPLLAAQVSVAAPWSESLAQGATILAAYVHGENTTQESIAVTRPVGMEPHELPIAGAVPVLAAAKGNTWLISSLMPSEWTEVTLPRPNDPRVRIVRVPERTVAVLTFSGGAGRDRVATAEERLRGLLARDKAVILGPAIFAQYQSSWVPPFLRRNEVILPIR